MGPSGGGATPLDLLFDSDSATMSDCFIRNSTLRTNLKVNPIVLESAQNLISNKKRNHPVQSLYERVIDVLELGMSV